MSRKRIDEVLTFENANIIFRNFQGKRTTYNEEGKRNFCVTLDEETARRLHADGWNVKWPKNPTEDDTRLPHLPVEVSFKNYPPKIFMITTGGKNSLDENNIDCLDTAEIKTADIVINPYNWDGPRGEGVKAYLKSLYVTLIEDEFEHKYMNIGENVCSSCGRCPSKGDCGSTDDLPF